MLKRAIFAVFLGAFLALGAAGARAADPGTSGGADEVAQVAVAPPPALPPAAPSPPSLLPAMGPTLVANPNPESFDLGPLGKVYATGVVSGLLLEQSNPVFGNHDFYADISNGQVFLQNASGPVQFFLQAGIYSLPVVGVPYTRATDLNSLLFGPLPQAFIKFAPTQNFSLEAGRLPTLLGNEATFTFENYNIERGLLWNQENVVNEGVQANYTAGPVALSLSWNDGFFSGNFDWLTGLATYTVNSSNSFTFAGGGAFGTSRLNTFATPIAQDNSQIYDLIYNGSFGPWSFGPYFQYTRVPKNSVLGFSEGASTAGIALLGAYSFNENWKLGARAEYVTSSGSVAGGAPNLLGYGPGSNAWSFTVTPTYQYKLFFTRAEFSYVGVGGTTEGLAFGSSGTAKSQVRVLFETGVVF